MGTTTNYGWPYPELTDPPDGPAQFKALANAVDATFATLTPVLRLRRDTVFSVPSQNASTLVPFNVVDEDPAGMSNTNGDVITVKTAGIWLVTSAICWGPSPTANRLMDLRVNTVPKVSSTTIGLANAWGPGLTLSAIVRLAVNDTLSIGAAQNSGAALSIGIGYPPFLAMDWLRI